LALPKDPNIYVTGLELYKDQVQSRSSSSIAFRHRTSLDAEIEPNVCMIPSKFSLFIERIWPTAKRSKVATSPWRN
jgi:hypothetical protein